MIAEVAEDTWASTHLSAGLSTPGLAAGTQFSIDVMAPCFTALPKTLKEVQYQNLTDGTNCALQRAFNTTMHGFEWFAKNPAIFANFSVWMTAQRHAASGWLEAYPFEEETTGLNAEKKVFVDVGGSVGHQCRDLVEKFPGMKGRVVLQDLEPVIGHAEPIEGVEMVTYNFWTPQSIKGKLSLVILCLPNTNYDYCH